MRFGILALGTPWDTPTGAEFFSWELAHKLAESGLEVYYSTIRRATPPPAGFSWGRVHYVDTPRRLFICDWLYGHTNWGGETYNLAAVNGRRYFYMFHNDWDVRYLTMHRVHGAFAFCSNWAKKRYIEQLYKRYGITSIEQYLRLKDAGILFPVLDWERINPRFTEKDEWFKHWAKRRYDVCMASLWVVHKGAETFYEIAGQLRDLQFVGIKAFAGVQLVREDLKNVEIVHIGYDLLKFLEQVRVVLFCGDYESFGRVAVEAAAQGCIVVYNKDLGVAEALMGKGIQCEHELKAYVKALESLLLKQSRRDALFNIIKAQNEALNRIIDESKHQFARVLDLLLNF